MPDIVGHIKPLPGWMCCFCYERIEDSGKEPLMITVRGPNGEGDQDLFAHRACYKKAMHPQIPIADDLT